MIKAVDQSGHIIIPSDTAGLQRLKQEGYTIIDEAGDIIEDISGISLEQTYRTKSNDETMAALLILLGGEDNG